MTPEDILRGIYQRAEAALDKSVIPDINIRERATYVCRCTSNRAGGSIAYVVPSRKARQAQRRSTQTLY